MIWSLDPACSKRCLLNPKDSLTRDLHDGDDVMKPWQNWGCAACWLGVVQKIVFLAVTLHTRYLVAFWENRQVEAGGFEADTCSR